MTRLPIQPAPDLGMEAPPLGDLPPLDAAGDSITVSAIAFLNDYAYIFVGAFLVTLLATPLIRKVAVAHGIVDHPNDPRKMHRMPVAYLGGVAVFLGLFVAIAMSYAPTVGVSAQYRPIPIAVFIGMVAITFTGLADDVWGWDPRLKVAGQLVAAAALAVDRVGVDVARGVLAPIFGAPSETFLALGDFAIMNGDVYYWVGTALIAVFVLGGCNAANLIDGLDGLLSGVVGITAVGLLAISLLMAIEFSGDISNSENSLIAARIVLSIALLGAVLGFLPYNFKPAVIFLGDCGSLLLGYMVVVIILMLGEMGHTHLVFAGLIVFAVPIIDTTLAIIRRKLAGIPMSAADDQHIHHQLKRALGTVRRAVFALYGLSALFAFVGVALAALVMRTNLSVRIIYALALVLFGFVGAIAVKVARHKQMSLAVAARADQGPPATRPAEEPAAEDSQATGDDAPTRESTASSR